MFGQTTLRLEMREFEPSQYEGLARLYGRIYPEYDRSPDEWRFGDETLDRSKYYFQRYSCFNNEADTIIGFGQVGHAPWMYHPNKYWIDIWVDPAHQGIGAGRFIYDKLLHYVGERDAVTVWTVAKEDMPVPLAFLAKRGFRETLRGWESRLKPAEVNLSQFAEYSQKAREKGITIRPLSEERVEDPNCLRKLHELTQLVSADMPSSEPYTPISFEQWESFEMKNPDLEPQAYVIAKDGSQYVGLSTLWKSQKDPKGLYQGLTGVRREYRGQGIAYAMKLKVIEWAQENGYDLIKTWNATSNAAMLAINIKLGFKRQVGWITFGKNLT